MNEPAVLPKELPSYGAPKPFVSAPLPETLQPKAPTKPHGIFNKVVGRMLKFKTPKAMARKSNPKPIRSRKKSKVL